MSLYLTPEGKLITSSFKKVTNPSAIAVDSIALDSWMSVMHWFKQLLFVQRDLHVLEFVVILAIQTLYSFIAHCHGNSRVLKVITVPHLVAIGCSFFELL